MSVIFVKIFLKSMIFVKILWYSEGHQTKPTRDNVHIPQTNVLNVKQFNQNSHPQKPVSFGKFKLNVVKRKVGRYLQFIRLSVSFCLCQARMTRCWQSDSLSRWRRLTSGDAC